PRFTNAEASVEREGAVSIVRAVDRHAMHGERSDPRSRRELALDARDGVRIRRLFPRQLVGHDLERADRVIARFARNAAASPNRHRIAHGIDSDAAREKEIDQLRRAGGKHPGVLEKKWPLLGK